MNDLERIAKIKGRVESEERRNAKLEGMEEEIEKQLKEKFACNTIAEAESKLKKMQREERNLSEQIEEELKILAQWEKKLDE